MAIRIEPLGKEHDRADFTSGEPALDDWFRHRAGQDERRHVARTFVAVDEEGIAGFYCLSVLSLALDEIPPELARKLPRYDDIPAVLIGRLARAERLGGQGLGGLLLADAIHRILAAERTLAAFAILVDAKNERAAAFYAQYGFRPFPLHPRRLFLLTATAAKGFAAL